MAYPDERDQTQGAANPAVILQVRIDISDAHPPIWRRLLLPANITLERLHHIIQAAFNWTDSHLHLFVAGQLEIGDPTTDDWGSSTLDEADYLLAEVLGKAGDRITYEYDFGDGWMHILKVEKILPYDPDIDYPVCTAGRRAGPLEDSGGIWGYEDLLAAREDAHHPEHHRAMEWMGEDFDPDDFDTETATRAIRNAASSDTISRLGFDHLTIMRWEILSPEVTALLVRRLQDQFPIPEPERQEMRDRIRNASTASAMVDLLPAIADRDATAALPWMDRLSDFAPAVVPLLARRLAGDEGDGIETDIWIQERIAVALHRLGPASVPLLLDVFDTLNDYGKALACLVLGQLGANESANRIWAYFVEAFETAETGFVLAPAWALIDLGDQRAADAIWHLIDEGWAFEELAAMAGHAGDRRVLIPLLQWIQDEGEPMNPSLAAAVALVGHRIGRDAIIAELTALDPGAAPPITEELAGALADQILTTPSVSEADAAFQHILYPLRPEDVLDEIEALSSTPEGIADRLDWSMLDDEGNLLSDGLLLEPSDFFGDDDWSIDQILSPFARLEPQEPSGRPNSPPSRGNRPGRNEPCWCGSGKKYKDCHWREDNQRDIPEAA